MGRRRREVGRWRLSKAVEKVEVSGGGREEARGQEKAEGMRKEGKRQEQALVA